MAVLAINEKTHVTLQGDKEIRNIFCVGRNYVDHAKELGNDVPTRPMIFCKPTHAITPASKEVVIPTGNIHHELEIVVWVQRTYQPGMALSDCIGGVALGLDLTERDVQSELKAKGHPWELSKGFLGSAVLSDFYAVSDWSKLPDETFRLENTGKTVQIGQARDMIFSFDVLLDYIASHFGLGEGDIVFTGTPAGVASLSNGDFLSLWFGEDCLAECTIRQG